MDNRPRYPGTPRWVKVFAIVVVIVVVLLIVAKVLIGGEHGPGRHTAEGVSGSQVLSSGLTEDFAQPEGGRG